MNTKENRRKKQIIVGIEAGDRPYHALIRGYQVAKAWDADLTVVHAIPEAGPRSWMLFPQRHAVEAADALARNLEIIAATEAWCDRVLPEPLGDRYVVVHGELLARIAEEVAHEPTRLVVLSADSIEARHANELANDLKVPVLLARARSSNSIVVAATDLRHERYPVLNEAAELAPAIAARLVCVHNRPPLLPGVDPLLAMFVPGVPMVVEEPRGDDRVLREAAASVAADSVLTGQARAVDAILQVARAQDADLIVVGAARHHSIYRWLTGSTAAAVARRARRSVLFAPLEPKTDPQAWVH